MFPFESAVRLIVGIEQTTGENLGPLRILKLDNAEHLMRSSRNSETFVHAVHDG